MSISRASGLRVVGLELFSGSGGLSKALERLGLGCVRLDHRLIIDVTLPVVMDTIIGCIRSRVAVACWLGPPCASWSRLMQIFQPIRSIIHIYGLPDASPSDLVKLHAGNTTMRCTARIIRCCIRMNILCITENPDTSLFWSAPPISALINGGQLITTDYCQFGARWRKRTRFLIHRGADADHLTRRCRGRNGICSLSGLHHIHLLKHSGKDWAHIAEAYPPKLARSFADYIIDTVDHKALARRFQLSHG